MIRALSRRSFLVGASGALAVFPALPSLRTTAGAQTPASPRRFVSIRTHHGPRSEHWFPDTSGLPSANLAPDVQEFDLTAGRGPVSEYFGERFDPLRSKLLFPKHLDAAMPDGHQRTIFLGGFNSRDSGGTPRDEWTPTIDQFMADATYEEGWSGMRFLNLVARRQYDSVDIHSYGPTAEGIAPLPAMIDPAVAFDQLFAGVTGDPDAAQRAREDELFVIDRVHQSYRDVVQSSRISVDDRHRFEQHAEYLFEVEGRIRSASAITCDAPVSPPARVRPFPPPEYVPELTRAFMDLIVGALRCDRTRVINFSFGLSSYTFLPGVNIGYHDLAHSFDPARHLQIDTIERWHAEFLAYLLEQLDAETNPDGSALLDSCAVLYGKELGHTGSHPNLNQAVLLAGSCNGFFRPGRVVSYATGHARDGYSQWVGRLYNELLITLMLAMGVEPSAWERGGRPGFGQYVYGGRVPENQVARGDQRSPLPGI